MPGGNRVKITMFVKTVQEDFGYLRLGIWSKSSKVGRVDGGEGKYEERVTGLLVSEIQSLEVLAVKKEPKLSASE